MTKNIVILISGFGSNMQSIVKYFSNNNSVKICAVISNKNDATGIEWAKSQNIPTHIIDHKLYNSRQEFDDNLLKCVQIYQPHIVVLAGFMRILTNNFIQPLLGKLINIHPSLLPKFKGLNTHTSVLKEKCQFHGATVHFVTTELDSGSIILQASIPVLKHDDEKTLAARVLEIEHIIYPKAIEILLQNKISLADLI